MTIANLAENKNIMLELQVNPKIMHEEQMKKCSCESCGYETTAFIYLLKNGICLVLSHVCRSCKIALEEDCVLNDLVYQFIPK